MLVILSVPYLSPKLASLRVARAPWEQDIGPDPSVGAALARADESAEAPSGPQTVAPVLDQGETELRASENTETVTNALPAGPTKAKEAPPVPKAGMKPDRAPTVVEDPSGHAMDAFYTQLAKSKRKEPAAVTRVMHYGDSMLVSDYVSGTMRRRMQAEYGDAGHGFMLTANPWDWYFHNDVVHGASEGWSNSRVVGPLTKDAMYGLGGVTFTGKPGATAWFGTASEKHTYGKKVSRFDVYYLETDGGGEVDAKVDGKTDRFSTKGEGKKSSVHSIPVTDGEQRLTLKVASGAPRIFGVALERDTPGVVWDSIGLSGARAELWNGIDQAHFAEQLALRKPALVVLQFGTNESETGMASQDGYEKQVRTLVEKVKGAAPGASVLLVAPLDRAEKDAKGALRTKPIMKRLVAGQRNVAAATRVAFFDTFEAMGGEGAMALWVKKGLAGSDLTHPSPQGAEIIGDMIFKALKSGFEEWQAKGGK